MNDELGQNAASRPDPYREPTAEPATQRSAVPKQGNAPAQQTDGRSDASTSLSPQNIAENPGGEEPMVRSAASEGLVPEKSERLERTMYGDRAGAGVDKIRQTPSEPVFLEKKPLYTPVPVTPADPSAKAPSEPRVDRLAGAKHETNLELLAEELEAKTIKGLEHAAETAEKLTVKLPEVNAKELLHNAKTPLKTLRSFQGDAAEALEKQKASIFTIKAAEEEKRVKDVERGTTVPTLDGKPEPEPKPEPVSKSDSTKPATYGVKAVSLMLSILLILIGISTIFIFNYFTKDRDPAPTMLPTLMAYDVHREVNATGRGKDFLVGEFGSLRSEAPGTPGSVVYLQIFEGSAAGQKEIDAARFLSMMNSKAPQSLVRSFGTKFMAGAYATDKHEPFVIVKITSFDNAYSGMLAWETSLADDIGSLFSSIAFMKRTPAPIGPNASSSATVSTAGPRTYFEDILVRNLDTRAARNENGEVAMLYSFVDRETLLFTTNEAAFQGIVDKLRASKLIR